MSSKELYTHLALACVLGVSVTTVKSYRRKFPGCIPVASQGKPIRFPQAARDVCVRIRDLFETGMSVAEVRARLAREFDWIAPEDPLNEPVQESPARIELPPLYTSAMSDMAQSLVGLAQKQGRVLNRLDEIGSALGAVQAPLPGCEAFAAAPAAPAEAAGGVHGKQEWMLELGELSRHFSATVSRLENCVAAFERCLHAFSAPPSAPAADSAEQPRQPDRMFLSHPLVVAGEDKVLRGIAGQGRGRFTCADIKALAACVDAPERACSLEWSESGIGWRLALRGRESREVLAVAFMREVSDNLGHTGVLLQQVVIGGQERHPADLLAFLRDLTG